MTANHERPLTIGTRVRLRFRGQSLYRVVAYRINRGGLYYSFESEDGYRATGYRDAVEEVVNE